MKEKRIKLRSRRVFSEEFKKTRVKEYEQGEYSVRELSKLFDIYPIMIYRWIHKYSTYNKKGAVVVEMKDSANQKLKEYEKRIGELERAVGQKARHHAVAPLVLHAELVLQLAEGDRGPEVDLLRLPHDAPKQL